MVEVPYWPGDGHGPELIDIAKIADFPRDSRGTCAYCHGDPCAERSGEDTLIGAYFARNRERFRRDHIWASCPMCDGRPT